MAQTHYKNTKLKNQVFKLRQSQRNSINKFANSNRKIIGGGD